MDGSSREQADWQIVLPDSTLLGNIRYTLQTDDGDLLYVRSRGVRHGRPEVLARLGRGEEVDAGEYVFRKTTQIETQVSDLNWLNKECVHQCWRTSIRGSDVRGRPRRMNSPIDGSVRTASYR